MNLFGGKSLFSWSWTTPCPPWAPLPGTTPPPENHTYGQYFQKKKCTWIDINV